MVKKTKSNSTNNTNQFDRQVSSQERQLETLEKLQKLEDRADKQLELIEEIKTKYKRALADYQNQERRHKEMESQIVKFAQATLIEKILLNIDSLEMAQSHLKDQGLQMVIDQFLKMLEGEGLKIIQTSNKLFDPNVMDCIEIVPGEKDHVIETVSKGYTLFDKVLRPAKVKVGNGEMK